MTSDHRITPGLIHDIAGRAGTPRLLPRRRPARRPRHRPHRRPGPHLRRHPGPSRRTPSRYPARHPDRPPITLTRADAITIFAAPDIAADDKRYRAEMCPDCPDQSCPACQVHLRDAQAFDQMAGRMLQAAQATPAASASQPAPDRWSQPAADREAGQ